jgi:hypothetical protein
LVFRCSGVLVFWSKVFWQDALPVAEVFFGDAGDGQAASVVPEPGRLHIGNGFTFVIILVEDIL